MALSDSERAALRGRASSLRTEISSLQDERDKLVTDAATERRDAKLLAEVNALESQREAAEASRARAEGSVGDAAALMEAAARQSSVVEDTDPTGSSPAVPAKTESVADKKNKNDKAETEEPPLQNRPLVVEAKTEGSK